ncbi:hypothetical protein CEXT_551081 [Caerostris extrusa]|uniref:Ribosomal protein S7 n=1 Tax=Caerostris extrusa TaxID=172846 RepID=A0AAV4NN89_CAEEX|nr:hypothetical protein CEXT_551081 [Caerostris extrusa]
MLRCCHFSRLPHLNDSSIALILNLRNKCVFHISSFLIILDVQQYISYFEGAKRKIITAAKAIVRAPCSISVTADRSITGMVFPPLKIKSLHFARTNLSDSVVSVNLLIVKLINQIAGPQRTQSNTKAKAVKKKQLRLNSKQNTVWVRYFE